MKPNLWIRMRKLELLKIKILTTIIRKLEPSKEEYAEYEKNIRKLKLDSEMGYNSALGFAVLSRALTRAIDHFIVFMIRVIITSIIAVIISIWIYG